jgi:hypothetical protein
MFPWLWFWSPTLHLPFSGSVAQRIEPDTTWFFAGIPAKAGNGAIEQKAFEIASYGSQIGWLTEVLLAAQGSDAVPPAKASEARAKLTQAYRDIEAAKKKSRAELARDAANALAKLHEADPAAHDRLIAAAPRPRALPR